VGRWRRQLGRAPFNGPPVIGADGGIYVVANLAYHHGVCYSRLYALDADGRCRWRHSQGWGIIDAPNLAADGTAWIPVQHSDLLAGAGLLGLDPGSGRIRQTWELPVTDQRPCQHGDLIYCGMKGESRDLIFLCAFRRTRQRPTGIEWPTYRCGTPVWHVELGSILSSPLITRDGLLLICARSSEPDGRPGASLRAFGPVRPGEPPVSERWRVESLPCSRLMAAPDGGVLLWEPGEALQAFGPGGVLRWQWRIGEPPAPDPAWAAIRDPEAWRPYLLVPAAGLDATYFCTPDGRLVAMGAEGVVRWEARPEAPPTAAPCALRSGGVLLACADGIVRAIDRQGQTRWRYQAGAPVRGLAVDAKDGRIYLGLDDGVVHALAPDGTVRWRFAGDLGVASDVNPVVGQAGAIHVSNGKELSAFSPAGRPLWTGATPLLWHCEPAVTEDGRILATGRDGNLHCVAADGASRWVFRGEDQLVTKPCQRGQGTIYVGGEKGTVYAVSDAGDLIWRFRTPHRNSPLICAGPDGAVYCTVNQYRTLYALDAEGRERWRLELADGLHGEAMTVSREGLLLVRQGHALLGLDAMGRTVWTFSTPFEPVEPPPLLPPECEASFPPGMWGPPIPPPPPRRDSLEVGPVQGPDGTIYLWGRAGFYALDAEGAGRWSCALEARTLYGRGIGVANDGTILAWTRNCLYVLDPAGEVGQRRRCAQQREIGGVGLGRDVLYLVTTDGYLQALTWRHG
jgi:outer membrane protein assembly factor BamB